MKRKHPGVYHDNSSPRPPEPLSSAANSHQQVLSQQQAIQPYVDQRQQQVTEALVDLLAGGLLDPALADTREFRRLTTLLDPSYEPPSASQLVYCLLPARRWGLQQRAVLMMEAAESVALTQDVWMGPTSCICICGHFILNWKLRSVFLACRYFVDADLGDSLGQLFAETVTQYSLGDKASRAAVYDAMGVVRSFQTSLPGFSICEEDSTGAAERVLSSEGLQDGVLDNLGLTGVMALDSKEWGCLFPEGLGCFAEALQLCVNDGLKENEQLELTVNKVSSVADIIRNLPAGPLDPIRHAVEVGCASWSSQLQALRACAAAPLDALQAAAPTLAFCPEDLELLREVSELMEPFEEAFHLSRAEGRITASYVVPCIRGLRAHLEALRPSCRLVPTVTRLGTVLRERLGRFEQSATYALCSMLDPRFKLRWCSEEEEQRRLTTLLAGKVQDEDGVNGMAVELYQPQEKRKSKLFRYMSPEGSSTVGGAAPAPMTQCWEVSSYLAAPCVPEGGCPLEFWHQHQTQYPKLARLASRLLALPATAAHLLRLSRVGGRVANPADSRLNGVTFENLMFIKCNQEVR